MIFTSIIATCLLIAIATCLLLVQSYIKVGKKYSGIKSWITGVLLHTLSIIISIFSDANLKDFTVPISGILVLGGLFSILVGINRFFDKFTHYYEETILMLLAAISIIYFNSFNINITFSLIALNVAYLAISLKGAFFLLKSRKKETKHSIIMTASFMFALAFIALSRIINAFYADSNATYHLANSTDYNIILIYYIIFTIMIINLNLLINDKSFQQMAYEQNKFKTIFSQSPLSMMMVDLETDIVLDVNETLIRELGYSKKDLIGKHYSQIRMFDLVKDRPNTRQFDANPHDVFNKEVPLLRYDGEILHSLLSISIVQQLEETLKIISLTDITEIYELKEKLDRYAYYDSLTELPNRRLFIKHFNSKVENRESFAIVTIDLDDFKQFNDLYGHDTGDEILKEIGTRLNTLVSGSNFAARYGGDEFVLLLHYRGYQEELTSEIQKVASVLRKELKIQQQSIQITASIGTAIFPLHGENLRDLMNKADIAMYQVKHLTKDDMKIFEE